MSVLRIPTSIWEDGLGFTLYFGNIDETLSLLISPTILPSLTTYGSLKIGSDGFDFFIDSLARKKKMSKHLL